MFIRRLIPGLLPRIAGIRQASSAKSGEVASMMEEHLPGQATIKDPNNYNIPLRQLTMDDHMEPYGSYKVALEAERKLANKTLLKGIICFSTALLLMCKSGLFDPIWMPNLDNIMEETEPFNYDKEGRVTV